MACLRTECHQESPLAWVPASASFLGFHPPGGLAPLHSSSPLPLSHSMSPLLGARGRVRPLLGWHQVKPASVGFCGESWFVWAAPGPLLERGPEGHLAKTNYGCRVECGGAAAEQAQTWQTCQWCPRCGFHSTGSYRVPGSNQARSRFREATGHHSAPVE